MTTEPLITWNNWADGIAQSPHLGNALLQGVEIDDFPGAARITKLPTTAFFTWGLTSTTFTADAASDVCTAASSLASSNFTSQAVKFTSSGTLPAGLTANVTYFLIYVSATTFKVATTIANANAGTAINITDAGTGTHTITPLLPGTIRHYAYDPRASTVFAIDSYGRVWYDVGNGSAHLLWNSALDTGSGTTALSGADGNGIAVFRVSDGSATYLFAFRNANIDVVNVFGTTQKENPSWTNGWKTMNSGAGSGNSHAARNGQDNIIYFPDDRYVGSIKENAGSVFDPGTAGTYTYNNQALDLPLGSLTYWLEELGVNLLISVSNDSYIYPWDRSSDSYGLPLPIGEYGGNKMKNLGNIVYILAGQRGNIYWTQGTYVRPFTTVPMYLANNSNTVQSNNVTWGGIASAEGKLIVGVGAASGRSGVYMLTADGKMTLDNIPSTGAANTTALFATSEFYQLGYAGGADTVGTSRYSTLGSVILQSQMYRIGNKTEKNTISQIEYQIANGVSGSIRVGYRTDLQSAFTNITTFTTAVGQTSDTYDCGLIDLENIQFQVELAAANGMDLMEFRAYK